MIQKNEEVQVIRVSLIRIFVEDWLSHTRSIEIDPNLTVLDLMNLTQNRTGFSHQEQNFFYKNKVFDERNKDTPLEQLGVVDNCIIHLIPHLNVKLMGG